MLEQIWMEGETQGEEEYLRGSKRVKGKAGRIEEKQNSKQKK
jgi:hypothetical protein